MVNLYEAMMAIDAEAMEFEVMRETVEPGLTFSYEAMERLHNEVATFIGTRVMRRWNHTNEPPTALLVKVEVEVR